MYAATHLLEYLDQCIAICEESLIRIAPQKFIVRAELLLVLANAKRLKYKRTNQWEFMEEAIKAARDLIPLSPPYRQGDRRYNLACLLTSAYEAKQDSNHLKEAIDIFEVLTQSIPPVSPIRQLCGLSMVLP